MAETTPFRAPPLDLDENEHASRRISTPLITMGLLSRLRAAAFEVLMCVKFSAFLQLSALDNKRNRSSAVDLLG